MICLKCKQDTNPIGQQILKIRDFKNQVLPAPFLNEESKIFLAPGKLVSISEYFICGQKRKTHALAVMSDDAP